MSKINNLTGKKFGRLSVIKYYGSNKNKRALWLCKCDCGNNVEVLGSHLRSNHTKSCGCLQKESCKKIIHKPKHGMIHTRIYRIWNSIKNRTNENSKYKTTLYKNYSGRNIKMCDEWKNDFVAFHNWAMTNGYKEGLTIDRINCDGDYEPNNCRWVTMKKQQNNKRNNVIIEYKGEKHTLTEWNEILNYTNGLLKNRLNRGWSIKRAFETSIRR